jgi:hypothetical protein
MNHDERIILLIECKSVPALLLKKAVWWIAWFIFALLLSNFVLLGCFGAQWFGVTLDCLFAQKIEDLAISVLFMLFCVTVNMQIYAYVLNKFCTDLTMSVFFFTNDQMLFDESYNATIAKILQVDVEDVVSFKQKHAPAEHT